MKTITVKIIGKLVSKPGDPNLWEIENNDGVNRFTIWKDFPFEVDKYYEMTVLDQNTEDIKTGNYRIGKHAKKDPVLVDNVSFTKAEDVSLDDGAGIPVEEEIEEEDIIPKGTELVTQSSEERINSLMPLNQALTLEEQKDQFKLKWALFKWIQKEILVKEDWHVSGNTKFLKKSGFRKFAQAFRLRLEIITQVLNIFDKPLIIRAKQDYNKWVQGQKMPDISKGDKIELDWQYEVKCRVTVSDGTFAEQTGIVGSWDNNSFQSPHDALGKAVTRAYSRAIADLVGYGVYSAEDLS